MLPTQAIVEYDVPDDLSLSHVDIGALAQDWVTREVDTQLIGDNWLDAVSEALLFVPSVILPFAHVPDRNVLINHNHPETVRITIASITPFEMDTRLFSP